MIKIELPVYKVKTPQTLLEFHVESLVIAEENKLKSSVTDKKGITEVINSVLFQKIKDKPKEIETYDDFLNTITLNDRDAIIAGLYHVSYGNEYAVQDTCPSCGKTNNSKVSIEDIGMITFYEGKPLEILSNEIELELPISKAKVIIKVPTLKDEVDNFDILITNDPIFAYTTYLPVKKIVYNDIILSKDTNPYDVLAFLSSLPAKDRKYLDRAYNEKINRYRIVLPYKVICKHCSNEFVSYINFLEQLFRMAFEE